MSAGAPEHRSCQTAPVDNVLSEGPPATDLKQLRCRGVFEHRSMLVFTAVDGVLCGTRDNSLGPARETLAVLTGRGIPIILTSHHSPGQLIDLQRELGVHGPFIAESGRTVYVPRGYFAHLPNLAHGTQDWQIVEFTPASIADAVELLMWLYRVSGDSPLLVGVGSSSDDGLLLREVDLPVVITNPGVDQRQLRIDFPDAYVTAAAGPGGLREAMLGPNAADSGRDVSTE
jgi:predicted mannosyl-3-phosphoglycerate phosphatase (HAD superfamily)